MTYLPNPTVTIGGIDYTGRTVGSVSVRRGRRTVYERPAAGFATIELIDVDAGSLGFDVGERIVIRMEDTTGTPLRIFTGIVSDWSGEVVSRPGEPVVIYRVQAVGPLAVLNRRNILFDGRPQETDGQRVLAAVTEGLPVIWEEFSLTQTWAGTDDETTWETVDPGFDPNLIDPGVYEVTALGTAERGYTALAVAGETGESAKGLLFETPQGFIGYADADRRPANAAAGFLDIPYTSISVDGIQASSQLADITNRVTVTYGTGDEAVTQTDSPSLVRFGLQETRLDTILAREQDANVRADDFLFSHSTPSVEFERLSVNLRGNIGGTLRDALLAVNSNDAVRVTGLPNKLGLGPQGFRGFVEGVTITVNDFQADISLFVSDIDLSFGSVLWAQVTDNITFDNVNPTLTWEDARRVTL